MPGLRLLPVPGFPYVIPYRAGGGKPRVLHGARDVAEEMRRDAADRV